MSARRAVRALAVVAAGTALVATTAGAEAAVVPSLGYDPADTGSMAAVSTIVGARSAWAKGWTGAGVDVAVIDTGVSPVAGLDGKNKVFTGPDLSFDGPGAATPGLDAFGHGTFMAGLIAGKHAGAVAPYTDPATFVGVAPDARIVNVKVGAADGATDVTQVIAAIDWVTQHAHDPGLNIRVISLSYGTESAQAYTVDPLAQAAEQAWKHGIVVVVAAGNDGKAAKTLADPAYDPYLIAAGGDDPMGTLGTSDDVVPDFAQHGNVSRPVDVIAPATHVLGLRVPGSSIDTLAGNTGKVGTRFQRGSGTSEAAAIVAGAAALLIQQYPTATPDMVKAQLKKTATKMTSSSATVPGQQLYWGNGLVNAAAASASAPAAATQVVTASTGTGTLDAARGGVYVTSYGVALTGQKDVFGQPFSSPAMAAAQVNATAWTGGIWNGSRWTGDGWTGSRWTTAAWTGTDWTGSAWTGSRWTGMTWDGARWTGTGWNGSRWSGSTWTGSRWSGSSWT